MAEGLGSYDDAVGWATDSADAPTPTGLALDMCMCMASLACAVEGAPGWVAASSPGVASTFSTCALGSCQAPGRSSVSCMAGSAMWGSVWLKPTSIIFSSTGMLVGVGKCKGFGDVGESRAGSLRMCGSSA